MEWLQTTILIPSASALFLQLGVVLQSKVDVEPLRMHANPIQGPCAEGPMRQLEGCGVGLS